MPDNHPAHPSPESFKDAARRSQEAGIADETAAYENAIEKNPPPSEMSDEDVIKLAEAEGDAGVPDVQTAAAADAAKERRGSDGEDEAHPS